MRKPTVVETATFLTDDLLDSLSAAFYRLERAERDRRLAQEGIYLSELTVARVNGLSIEIRVKEHAPPHFHITYQGEDASFSITECRRLPGVVGLERFDGTVRA